jgi:hypothetical protein
MIKITKEEFLDRVRTSESTLQEAFTNEAIKAIHTTLHAHAINALALPISILLFTSVVTLIFSVFIFISPLVVVFCLLAPLNPELTGLVLDYSFIY